jgi:outer membrane protein OmpA-like peptidoglycan-associated protein
MHHRILLLASVAACGAAISAHAQVSTDRRALDQIAPPAATAPAQTRPTPPTAPARSTATTRPVANAAPVASDKIYGPPRPPPPAPLPPKPPVGPVIPAPIAVPTRPVPPPPPIAVAPNAPGVATPLPDGLRVTFGSGRAELNPVTEGALRALVHKLPPFDTTVFTVTSTAALQADDPSTPRRLALSRALAVRGVLIAEGVASPRIIVKVVGDKAVEGAEPPNMVDVVAASPQTTTP